MPHSLCNFDHSSAEPSVGVIAACVVRPRAKLKISARGAFKDLDAPRLVDQWIGLIGDCPAIASVASIRVRTLVIPIGVMKFFSVK
jgi:hypothetical protein